MKKEDLKLGNIIETKEEKMYLYNSTDADFINLDGVEVLHSKHYDNDLKHTENPGSTIVKIYEDYTLTNLLWKRPEPRPELSAKEKNILVQALSDGYRWIARDKDNEVWLFDVKPHKANFCGIEVWLNGFGNDVHPLILCKDLFTFLHWEDKKPTKIKDLLIAEE